MTRSVGDEPDSTNLTRSAMKLDKRPTMLTLMFSGQKEAEREIRLLCFLLYHATCKGMARCRNNGRTMQDTV